MQCRKVIRRRRRDGLESYQTSFAPRVPTNITRVRARRSQRQSTSIARGVCVYNQRQYKTREKTY